MTPVLFDIRTVLFLLCVGNLAVVAILAAYPGRVADNDSYRQFLAGKLVQAIGWLQVQRRGGLHRFLALLTLHQARQGPVIPIKQHLTSPELILRQQWSGGALLLTMALPTS